MVKNLKVSIIIRTKNEEKWINHCLNSIFKQKNDNLVEIIIVDNNSKDKTLEICKKYKLIKILKIKNFKPGKAINLGIEHSKGDIICILSAHCIIYNSNWLNHLLINFKDKKVAGVYGRQLPLPFSKKNDVRDMLITFGLDKKIQIKDPFFHNANSAVRRSIVKQYPFDNKVTNIEDRIWAKKILSKGFKIIYEPLAKVFHYHGIHHDQEVQRSDNTFDVLKSIENKGIQNLLPKQLKPNNLSILALISVSERDLNLLKYQDLLKLKKEILNNNLISKYKIILPRNTSLNIKKLFSKNIIYRHSKLNKNNVTLNEVLKHSLVQLEKKNNYFDLIVIINPNYLFRPKRLFNKLILSHCINGYDTVFMAAEETQDHWFFDDKIGKFEQIYNDYQSNNKIVYKSLVGLGSVTLPFLIRNGKIIGNNVGIIPIKNKFLSLRNTDIEKNKLIKIKKIFNSHE